MEAPIKTYISLSVDLLSIHLTGFPANPPAFNKTVSGLGKVPVIKSLNTLKTFA